MSLQGYPVSQTHLNLEKTRTKVSIRLSANVRCFVFQNVLVIDIDKRSFVRSQGDEHTLLPKKLEKALKTSLNMCRIDSGTVTAKCFSGLSKQANTCPCLSVCLSMCLFYF